MKIFTIRDKELFEKDHFNICNECDRMLDKRNDVFYRNEPFDFDLCTACLIKIYETTNTQTTTKVFGEEDAA